MDQNPLATSVCVPSPQETPQYQNQYTFQEQQEQKRQQRMMLYGAPTPIASPENSQHQISSEQFHEPQNTQQPYRQPESTSIQPKYQLDGDRPQDEKRDAIQSGSYTSVNWKNTKSPHSFHSDSSIHPSANASKQSSPYMSPQNQFLNHTNNKYELSTTEFQPPQQGMACIRPPNTIPVLAQDLHPSYYQSQEEYSVGHKHAFFYQQHRPRLTTTVWEDEGTLCFQVDAKGICVARRQDNNMVNGTKLLNVVGMSRGKRDGILKNEKRRVVVKVGAMHLKGVWITLERAKHLSAQFHILDLLYPLFVDEPNEFLFSPGHDSIFPFSPPISQLLQDGPGITQRQSSPLYTSGIMGYTLGLGRQPPMFPGPTAVFPAERVHCTGAKFNGRNSRQSDMYLQFPAMGIDLRGSGNSACFQHPNGGYPSSFPPHFPNHSFKDYRPPSTPSTTSRYMTATGGTFAATDSTYIGEPNVEISNAPQYEQHLNSCQLRNQNQLDQHRQTLHAMSSEPNGIQARNTHSRYATSPKKPAPSNANITSLTFLSPIDGMYRPNDVPQMLLEISRTGCGSEAPSLEKFETRKRGRDNGPIASTQTSCISGNNFPSPLSVSPPATPTQHPSEDSTQFHSCSPPSPKRIKPEQLDQALLQANGLSSQQQFLPSLPNVKESSGEKQHDQSHNVNGQCLPCTNGLKDNVPSSNEQGVDPEQSIPPPLQLYSLPQTKSNPLDINQSSYDLGDEPSDISTGTVQQNEPLNQY